MSIALLAGTGEPPSVTLRTSMDFLSGLLLPWRFNMGESTRFRGGSAPHRRDTVRKNEDNSPDASANDHRHFWTLIFFFFYCKVSTVCADHIHILSHSNQVIVSSRPRTNAHCSDFITFYEGEVHLSRCRHLTVHILTFIHNTFRNHLCGCKCVLHCGVPLGECFCFFMIQSRWSWCFFLF